MHYGISILLVLTVAMTAAEPWPGAVPERPVTTTDVSLTLPGGTASMRVHHPKDPTPGEGPWPIIVFSHGLAGSREGYAFLGSRWAAHGYVSIHPDHPGSDWATFRAIRPGELGQALRRATIDPQVLQGRPKLIAQIIDALPELEKAVPALAGRMDRDRLGVGGHSFGAWTTMGVAGQRLRLPDGTALDGMDPRPRAFAALSPGGRTVRSQDSDWSGCTRPVLVMTGTNDNQPAVVKYSGDTRDGAWRRQAYEMMPAGDKMLAWFDGSLHGTYSGGAGAKLMGEPDPDPAQVEAVAVITLAWWDAHLRSDPRAKAWLADFSSASALGKWAHFSQK